MVAHLEFRRTQIWVIFEACELENLKDLNKFTLDYSSR